MTVLISIGIFLTVVLFIEGAFYAYHAFFNPRTNAIKRRLRGSPRTKAAKQPQEQVEVLRRRAGRGIPWVDALFANVPRLDSIERMLQQANSSMPLGIFMLLSGLTAGIGLIVAAVNNVPMLPMLGCTLGGGCLPFFYMRRQRKQRFQEFHRQLPDALDLVGRALRAGHAFTVGMKMVGDEFPDPIGPEFSRAVEEIAFGIDVGEALMNLSTRIECVDLRFFVTSIIVQRETGGNLAEILESISRLIRQRFELLGRTRALSAEGRLSCLILFAMPFVIGGLLWHLNPSYMELLITDPLGKQMLTSGLVMMTLGAFMMKRMVAIKV